MLNHYFFKKFALCLPLLILLSGCFTRYQEYGNEVDEKNFSLIKTSVNKMTKKDIRKILGSPTIEPEFDSSVWIYAFQKNKSFIFLKPYTVERKIVVFDFNQQNILKGLEKYGLKDGIYVSLSSTQKTKVIRKHLNIIEKVFGNIGYFKPAL